MKKGDKRQIVDIKDKATGKVIGKREIIHRNNFAGLNGWMMSWDDKNKAAKPNSKRQRKLAAERAAK